MAKHIFLVVLHVFVKSPFGKYIAKLSKPSGERGTLKCHSKEAQTQNPGWVCKFQLNCPDFTISPLLPQRTPRIYCHYLGGKTPLSDRDLSFSKAEGTRCLSKLPRSHFVCMQNRRYFHPCSLTSLTHTHESWKGRTLSLLGPHLVNKTPLMDSQTAGLVKKLMHLVADWYITYLHKYREMQCNYRGLPGARISTGEFEQSPAAKGPKIFHFTYREHKKASPGSSSSRQDR